MCRRLTYLFSVGCLMVLLAAPEVVAQNFSGHNWYFGNTTRGIQFSRGTNLPTLINNKAPLSLGGSAVATNQINGNLLFYTNGVTVFDVNHLPMSNGALIASAAAGENQPVAISNRPGVEKSILYILS